MKRFFETPGSRVGAGKQSSRRSGGNCTDSKAIAGDNPNKKLVHNESGRQMSENTSVYIYHEGHSIESASNACSLGSIADHKYFFSPGRYTGNGGNQCYQELCHVTTKAYNNGGSVFRHPDNGTGCTTYIEGQYPNDPDMCDFYMYAQDMCVQGYDITDNIDDSVSTSCCDDDLQATAVQTCMSLENTTLVHVNGEGKMGDGSDRQMSARVFRGSFPVMKQEETRGSTPRRGGAATVSK